MSMEVAGVRSQGHMVAAMLGGELHPVGGAHIFFTRMDVQFLALNSHSASYCEPVS